MNLGALHLTQKQCSHLLLQHFSQKRDALNFQLQNMPNEIVQQETVDLLSTVKKFCIGNQ